MAKTISNGNMPSAADQMAQAHAEIHQHHKMLGEHHTQTTDVEDSRDAAIDASTGEVDAAY